MPSKKHYYLEWMSLKKESHLFKTDRPFIMPLHCDMLCSRHDQERKLEPPRRDRRGLWRRSWRRPDPPCSGWASWRRRRRGRWSGWRGSTPPCSGCSGETPRESGGNRRRGEGSPLCNLQPKNNHLLVMLLFSKFSTLWKTHIFSFEFCYNYCLYKYQLGNGNREKAKQFCMSTYSHYCSALTLFILGLWQRHTAYLLGQSGKYWRKYVSTMLMSRCCVAVYRT